MPMKKLDNFDNTLVGQTLWGILQLIGENIALNKDPMDWIFAFAEISEMYGRL